MTQKVVSIDRGKLEKPESATHCSVEGDTMRITDENGKTIAKFHRVYVSHWWVWAEDPNGTSAA